MPAAESRTLERVLKQRVYARNPFVKNIHHQRSILKAGVIPAARARQWPEREGDFYTVERTLGFAPFLANLLRREPVQPLGKPL